MVPRYKFLMYQSSTLSDPGAAAMWECYPIYDSKLAVKYAKENNYKFLRASLDGKLKFVKDDYTSIVTSSLNTYNIIKVQAVQGENITEVFTGYFRRTDCTINPSDELLEVKLHTLDGYTAILEGLEKEFDLISLAPDIVPINMIKRPLLQVYSPGESVVSTYSPGGIYWEQECEAISDTTVLNTEHGFYFYGDFSWRTVNSKILLITAPEEGEFRRYVSSDKTTVLQIVYTHGGISWEARLYINDVLEGGFVSLDQTAKDKEFTCTSTAGASYKVSATVPKLIYIRVIHDNQDSGEVLINIKNKSQFGDFHNYRYATPYDIPLSIFSFDDISSEPTKYGQRQPGEYYVYPQVPAHTGLGPWFPVSKTTWGHFSYWLSDPYILDQLEIFLNKPFTLKHAYPLASCINRLLAKIAPDITFAETEYYSKFFYSRYNPISSDSYNLYLTPITNILEGEYDQPAQKMTISLANILKLLENCFQVHWFIADDTNLRLEHISFFENGHSYSQNAKLEYDTTKLIHPRSKKPWSLLDSDFTYDLDKMPEQYDFSWADDSSKPFNGYPIRILDTYVKKGQIEKVSVAKFSTDVDFMLANPEHFSKDGNALIAAMPVPISNQDYDMGSYQVDIEPDSTYTVAIDNRFAKNGPRKCAISLYARSGSGPVYLYGTYIGNVIPYTWNRFVIRLPKGASFIHLAYRGEDTLSFYLTSDFLTALDEARTYRKGIQGGLTYRYFRDITVKEKDTEEITYSLQNGHLSFADLVPKYHLFNLPSINAEVNNEPLQDIIDSDQFMIYNVEPGKFKKQKIELPLQKPYIQGLGLIRTSIGDGVIDDAEINLSSLLAKITLKHDTK